VRDIEEAEKLIVEALAQLENNHDRDAALCLMVAIDKIAAKDDTGQPMVLATRLDDDTVERIVDAFCRRLAGLR